MARERTLTAEELARIPAAHRPPEDQLLLRSEVLDFDLPPLNRITNRIEVLFDGDDPAV